MATSSIKVIVAALVGNTLVAITKFIAAAMTGSAAMFSEGIHSLVDTGNQVLLLYGIHAAKRPPDERFPFGHGKEIYFWSFVVAILVFALGAGVSIYQGIDHVRHPVEIDDPVINYVVLGLAMLFEGFALFFALTEFTRAKGKWGYIEAVQRGKDPTLFIVLFEDAAAMTGLVVAFAGVFLAETTGMLWWDGAASIVIGLILAGTAIWLAYETKGLLIGESANKRVVDGIRAIVTGYYEIRHVNEVLTMHMGPDFILCNLSVDLRDELSAEGIEQVIEKMDNEIKRAFPSVKRIFIEAEARRRTNSENVATTVAQELPRAAGPGVEAPGSGN